MVKRKKFKFCENAFKVFPDNSVQREKLGLNVPFSVLP